MLGGCFSQQSVHTSSCSSLVNLLSLLPHPWHSLRLGHENGREKQSPTLAFSLKGSFGGVPAVDGMPRMALFWQLQMRFSLT